MDKLAFTALASIKNQANMRAQVTNNLANVSTVGFKDTFSLAEQANQIIGEGLNTRVLPGMAKQEVINLSPGALNMTGNVMDVALNDKTVLGIQAGNGEVGFTRRGDLRVSATGLIENAAGQLILGENGPISVPQGLLVSIGQDGTVVGKSTTKLGTIPMTLGQLMLRDASEMPLTRRADGLFQPLVDEFQGKDFPTGPHPVSLVSGAIEGSNVNPVEAMVKMMDISRSYESKIKTIAEIKSIDESGASMMRLPQ
ncbi:MAG: flagellar basal-body rod protein FlgF [Arenicella sp.]|jgi:flagellar basal-body rod protein FlgF